MIITRARTLLTISVLFVILYPVTLSPMEKPSQKIKLTRDTIARIQAQVLLFKATISSPKNSSQLVDQALQEGAQVTIKNYNEETPLHYAALNGNILLMKALLNKGANIDARDRYQRPPLHWALASKNENTTNFLIENGAMLTAQDFAGRTVLHLLIQKNSITSRNSSKNLAHKLIRLAPELLAIPDKRGALPLHYAAIEGNAELLTLLITYIQKSTLITINSAITPTPSSSYTENLNYLCPGNTALHCAAFRGHHTIITQLLEAGAAVELVNKQQLTPLQMALESENDNDTVYTVASLLLRYGANPKVVDKYKNTLAHRISYNTIRPALIELLFSYGAPITELNNNYYSPLATAVALYDEPELVNTLIIFSLLDGMARTDLEQLVHPEHVRSVLQHDPLMLAVYDGDHQRYYFIINNHPQYLTHSHALELALIKQEKELIATALQYQAYITRKTLIFCKRICERMLIKKLVYSSDNLEQNSFYATFYNFFMVLTGTPQERLWWAVRAKISPTSKRILQAALHQDASPLIPDSTGLSALDYTVIHQKIALLPLLFTSNIISDSLHEPDFVRSPSSLLKALALYLGLLYIYHTTKQIIF